jgi:hypothetical protein
MEIMMEREKQNIESNLYIRPHIIYGLNAQPIGCQFPDPYSPTK